MSRVESGQEVFKISRVESGRVERFSNLVGRVRSSQDFFEPHGSGRVKSFQISRVESGRVGSRSFQNSWVGSGRVKR